MGEELLKGNYNPKVIQSKVLHRHSVSRHLESVEHSALATGLSRHAQPCVDALIALIQLVKSQTVVKRNHVLQNVETNSLQFMQSKNERPVEPKWTKLEHILV